MSTLHLVFTAPSAGSAFADCLRSASATDTVLLLQDAVGAVTLPLPADGMPRIVAHRADVQARGLLPLLPAGMQLVDDDAFVALTETHARIVSWFDA